MQNLQPYSHYCFSKISRTLFDFLNNTYWVSFFVRNNSLIFCTDVSCFSVTLFYSTLFWCGGKANLVRFTLFYSTLLTLTDGNTDRGTNTLASHGLEEPAQALRGLEEPYFQFFNLRKFLLGFFFLQKQLDPNFLLLCISFLLCMDLQSYNHDYFSKILRTLFDFWNNTYWVSLF